MPRSARMAPMSTMPPDAPPAGPSARQLQAVSDVKRFAGLFRRLGADRRGAIAILFAVMFPVVVGTLGVGIETGVWFGVKRHNQAIADVAAYSGALQIAFGTSVDQVAAARTAAKGDSKLNGF